MFIYFKPVKKFENGSDGSEFRCLDNSAGMEVLNLLESMYFTAWKIVIERITVVEFGLDTGSCDHTSCFGVKVRTDAAKFVIVRITAFRRC